MTSLLLNANALNIPLSDNSVQCVVTSPPYWGLRDYGVSNQLGLERVPDCLGWATKQPCGECYICHMVAVFREVWRVMRDDGVMFLNLGDSYARSPDKGGSGPNGKNIAYSDTYSLAQSAKVGSSDGMTGRADRPGSRGNGDGLKQKDLIGIPWRVALALQADGWYLRSDIIWAKPNPMPESVTDRPTKAHEYIFLLTKQARYFWDQEAVKEESVAEWTYGQDRRIQRVLASGGALTGGTGDGISGGNTRNLRTVWTIATQPTKEAHFATFPEALAERCIKAGSRMGDIVFDPFSGSGTVARVAIKLNRRAVGTELSLTYLLDIAAKRTSELQPAMV